MRIKLDKIETTCKLSGLGLKRTLDATAFEELYFDTELLCYFAIRKDQNSDSKYSGKIIIERSAVGCCQVASESVPEHQPIGTPETHDTPSGGRKHRSTAGGKAEIAKRSAARAAAKKSAS